MSVVQAGPEGRREPTVDVASVLRTTRRDEARPEDGTRREPLAGWLIVWFVALTPFDGLQIIWPLPGPLVVWKQALLLAIVAAALLPPRRDGAPRARRTSATAVCAVALLSLATLWALVAPSPFALLGWRSSWIWILLLIAVVVRPLGARQRDALVGALMITAIVTALVGLAQQIVGPAALANLGYQWNEHLRFAGGIFRSIGTFNQPFGFALHLATAMIVGVPVALATPGRLRNRVFLWTLPLIVLALFSTVVRGGIVMLAVGLFAVALFGERRVLLVLLPCVGLLLVVLAMGSSFGSNDSLNTRVANWQRSAPGFVEQPWGQGLSASGLAAQAERVSEASGSEPMLYRFSDGPDLERLQPDNQFVVTAITLGVPGLLALLGVVVSAFGAAGRAAGSRYLAPEDRALAIGAGGVVAGACAASMFSSYLEIFPVNTQFWILVGVVACLASSSKPSP